MSESDSPRRILHERSPSHNNELARIRLVPSTPPQLLGRDGIDEIYSRTPLPTHPSHFLGPGKAKGKEKTQGLQRGLGLGQGSHTPALDEEFQRTTTVQAQRSFSGASTSSGSTTHTHQPQRPSSATGSPSSRPKPPAKKRLHIHKDNKTFSLLQDDPQSPQSVDDGSKSPTSLFSASQKSSDSLPLNTGNARNRSNSTNLCAPEASSAVIPATPSASQSNKQPISADHITNSPWNYQLVGGLRKVPKTPDLKQRAATSSESPLPPLPETSDGTPTGSVSHDLSTKPSFVSTESTTTTSENTNYKIYGEDSATNSDAAPPSSSGSNYQVIGESSPPESVIYRPRTSPSEEEHSNYELHGDLSPENSYTDLRHRARYSQESLVVPPLNTKLWCRRSNETLGYYKSRSRESLRTGSLTSISTVLSQQEAFRAIVGSGALIQLPILKQKPKGSSSWAEPPSLSLHPPRSHMNEHPHQWSSQLSTVLSVSDGGTDRNSRSWASSDNGRRSSGYPSSQSRHSRQMLSISSSVAQEEHSSRSRTDSIEAPAPAFARGGRHNSTSSIRMVEDLDEYGDGITDMQDLRARPSRTRLSSYFNSGSSDNGRTNTMRSTNSSRANSLLAGSIPTWAKLYYGSGERRYIGAPGSSTEGTDSRSNSFRTGSPNTDHFPLSIYSPRRRLREMNGQSTRGSMEITPAPRRDDDGRFNTNDPYSRRFRTWSMSSIWSPHLRLDRRATRRSVWEPPSVNWSTEGGWFGRRNVQIVMFIVGFIFPFSWMIAALLPLPPRPLRNMSERDNSRSNLDSSYDRENQHETPNDYTRQFGPMDEARYESAKWWRRLNRCMSFVGVLVLAAIAVLVVVGVNSGW
ncbi:hypothetical protein ONS96_008040 [Cadophora gregata f. sp. sojae]|nr:hypothetical protein ONS96_008040 [Cadophora gregata f. sp. sojae]